MTFDIKVVVLLPKNKINRQHQATHSYKMIPFKRFGFEKKH
jgi:hypothetical protein